MCCWGLPLLAFLAACGGPAARPAPAINVAATLTREVEVAQLATLSAPTATPRATATTAASPTPVRRLVTAGACRIALPDDYREDEPGSGYYPAADDSGFIALDWPEVSAGSTVERASEPVRQNLRNALDNYQESNAARDGNAYRVDFTGEADGRPGRGTLFVKPLNRTYCAVTLFAIEGASLP